MFDAFRDAGVHELVVDAGSGDLDVNRDIMQRVRTLVD
jgi:hypothetical protein